MVQVSSSSAPSAEGFLCRDPVEGQSLTIGTDEVMPVRVSAHLTFSTYSTAPTPGWNVSFGSIGRPHSGAGVVIAHMLWNMTPGVDTQRYGTWQTRVDTDPSATVLASTLESPSRPPGSINDVATRWDCLPSRL